MRKFHSYGPVDFRYHFCVQRKGLVQQCFDQITGAGEEYGHYFTIWAPRQTGKTWIINQVKQEIEKNYGDRFVIGSMSMQGIVIKEEGIEEIFLEKIPHLFWETFAIDLKAQPSSWEEFKELFSPRKKIFNKPVFLIIDEFDSLPLKVIDHIVTIFRDMYLKRENYLLFGLALIGVRAVLGVDSLRGSPFNIQRSLHVPNLTKEEVQDLFQQYQHESGQKIDSEVIENLYSSTRGQPGLVSWFGELLTEKYNPGREKAIDLAVWDDIFEAAIHKEWNNTILNLITKAKGTYVSYVLDLFIHQNMPFNIWSDWCSYLYLNGIIDEEKNIDQSGKQKYVCRFASPFIQRCLHSALTEDFVGERMPILALEPLDDLSDIFENEELNLYALLERYKSYLNRLKAKGLNPWKNQPRRADLHLTEAVGHFHLYSWLNNAIGRQCSISPEFPTGNGRVDIHIKCSEKNGIIEVKSFTDLPDAKKDRIKASCYAKKVGLKSITMAVFVPVEDETVLAKISGEEIIDGINVRVFAIGWV